MFDTGSLEIGIHVKRCACLFGRVGCYRAVKSFALLLLQPKRNRVTSQNRCWHVRTRSLGPQLIVGFIR